MAQNLEMLEKLTSLYTVIKMPRLSTWKPVKDNNYKYVDRTIGQYFYIAGTGVLLHKYLGPEGENTNESTIQDVLFLENRSRKYCDDLIELRGVYKPEDSDFDLSQFGIFLSSDTIAITFHYTTMLNSVGRKLMAGDVIEMQHVRDPDSLDEDRAPLNRLYVIEDAQHSSDWYGPNWWSHVWKVKAKMLKDSPEFSSIFGHGSNGTLVDSEDNEIGPAGSSDDLKNDYSNDCLIQDIVDRMIEEAEKDVMFDPKFVDASHLYVDEIATGQYNYFMWCGDGIPPNGKPLTGKGDSFPPDLQDGDFYLRTDFTPDRLFRKKGNMFLKIEDDMRYKWTAYNRKLDTFIDNKETDTHADGSVKKQKTALSKVLKPKVNKHQDKLNETKGK